jgi:ferric-dicitrate binding protein FerR (iron transport regulator)
MSRDDMQYTPDEQQALQALRALDRPRASSEARARARAAFLAGQEPQLEVAPPEVPGPSRLRFFVPLAAAAVLVLAFIGMWQYASGPRAMWSVTDVVEAEGVEGVATEGMLMQTDPVTVTTGPQSEFELQLGRMFRFRMLPGAEVELPRPPRRWKPEPITIAVRSGEIYGTTGGQKLDVPLRVEAQNAIADVYGTTFAVFEVEDATCVCLWLGTVVVTNRADGSTFDMVPETKFFVYDDGTVSGAVPIDDMERMKLSMMEEAGLLELGD